ncbi:MAG: pre-peptidase C-terminal domain-containing protein, partial [Gammaproteobacteria bacterium]|nr:pre-peptidase C-terminal domain-containing protein [Gammaproteobacteria bacterium]
GSRYISSNSGRANLTPNTDWQVAGIGDLNGDGRDDVLLRRGDGRWHYYAMNGSRYISSNSGRANLTPNTDWMIPSAGSNGGMGGGGSGDDGRDTGAPDLTLEHNNTAGPLVVTAGESFFYQVGVLNQGSVPSGPTTLRYYRSSDSTISSSDTQVRTDSIRGLQAGELLAVSLGLSAPSTAGTYYYGSCVDAVSSESNTRNNCSDGIRVTVSSDDTGGGGTGGDDDHSNTRSGATSLSPNSSRAGRIDPGNDTDYFAVQLSESGTLTVYTTGSLDTTGQLLSSSGSSLGSDDDGGSGTNFRIEREVSAGTYYIKVESYRTNTGSYTLHADFRGGGGGASVLRASGGSACSDTIHLRFFEDRDDVTSSSAQWPGGGRVYVLNNGERYQQSLSCTPGYKVCYGARNTRTNSYWGVDIDASKGCSDCCQTCPASGSRDWNLGNLRCDGGDDGGGSGGDPVLVFRVEDACNDGYDLQYRFFEQFSGGSLTGRRIPGDGSVYVTGSFGQSHSHRLNCSSSAGYCLGANRRGINETRYWGVGIDGDQSCTDCCYSCPTSGERTVGRRLVCQ